jgi:hypothetical protein
MGYAKELYQMIERLQLSSAYRVDLIAEMLPDLSSVFGILCLLEKAQGIHSLLLQKSQTPQAYSLLAQDAVTTFINS